MDAPVEADFVGFAPKVGRGVEEEVVLKEPKVVGAMDDPEPKVVGAGDDPGPNEVDAGDNAKMDLTAGGLGSNKPVEPKDCGLPKTPTTGLGEVLGPSDGLESADPPKRLEVGDWNGVTAGGTVLLLS